MFLIAGTIYAPARQYLRGIDIYIFIGGLAVLVVSLQAIHKDVFSFRKRLNNASSRRAALNRDKS